ncbi:hypothetical protein K6V39_05460 [Streptococcus suis]|uniref:hypothetical protein n=1 Tax=Streptococcus suis TaxID=1307 RepID=UPI0005CCC86A|nr:hypothetical protein [Streptococcus suis]MBY4962048.1 hypothetical protein [Streptococcus suis]MBY4968382.1 hypothetical protein [Streptococcus suis]MBY4975890.1 hypothetical protein [Streptococcus suis]MBY4979460.1 hypothetical protein [Streptococcus suis]MBY4988069.1 hypothetical protein [Streptococcus suis]
MARGKPVPANSLFDNPTNISAVVDKSTKLNLEIIAGELVRSLGYPPTQGQVIDFLTKYYLDNNKK